MIDGLTDLGWGNGWAETPAIVTACTASQCAGVDHDYSERPTNHAGCKRVTCHTCGYTYQFDSGD